MRFRCTTCEEDHDGLPELAFDAPATYYGVPEAERGARAFLNSDLCVVDDEHYFVRAVLLLPIRGTDEDYGYGVWASLSKPHFDRYLALFDGDPPPGEGPWFAWLGNSVPGYPETHALKTRLHLRQGGDRPCLELEPTDHPLAVHQREGIELAELVERLRDRLH